eukprot:GHVU01175428.1.p1 GENE.GHVU01175428.1~~GHVU01175428.1.p1  ORF type:complete len:167 (+),score=8.74 GHVU01175428.1:31-501(+)
MVTASPGQFGAHTAPPRPPSLLNPPRVPNLHTETHTHSRPTNAPTRTSTRIHVWVWWVGCDPSTRGDAHDVDADLRCRRCGVRVGESEDGSDAAAGRSFDAPLPPHLSSPAELHRHKDGSVNHAGWFNEGERSEAAPPESGNLLCCRSAEHLPRVV